MDNLDVICPIPKEILDRLQKFQKQLDKTPDKGKIVEENLGGQRFRHLPVSHVEHLLKRLYFGLYQIEIISYGMIVNEVTVHCRIWTFHPILGQWMRYDGLGAIPVLQDAGTKVADFMQAKKTKALNLNLPAAYALAVKNAAKKIGKIFGGDLNRKHEDHYAEFPINIGEPLNE
jgi:hypothetical protein